jgi:hypothetical protein
VKRYSQGFKLRFYDRVDQLSVFLYVSPDIMAAYRYRKYLAHVIEQADAVRYFKVFALGTLRRSPSHDSIDLVVEDLHHLAIILGPKVATPPSKDDSPRDSSSTETK